MLKKNHFYLIHLQFLGFRYHGWQKQKDFKTVQFMLDRTLCFILGHDNFKTLGASRTDAMVSAHHHLSELFTTQEIVPEELLHQLNLNLPADIRATEVEKVNKDYQIIGSEKRKEYHYYFSNGEKSHPFCAPYLINFRDTLDIETMKEGAKLFEGTHYFKNFCFRPNESKDYLRTIELSQIHSNNILTASFFPEQSWYYRVIGQGFLHHQIRLMMGTLLNLGQHKLKLTDIEQALKKEVESPLGFVAPASGLHLINSHINGQIKNQTTRE